MTEEGKKYLNQFNRLSKSALLFYVIAVTALIVAQTVSMPAITKSTMKLSCFGVYLFFMITSLVSLKNYFEHSDQKDYANDILIFTILGVPLYLVGYIYIRIKLKTDFQAIDQ